LEGHKYTKKLKKKKKLYPCHSEGHKYNFFLLYFVFLLILRGILTIF